MRTPAAIADGGWIRRLVVRCGATTVALLGHIAILLALAYDPTHDPSLLEPVAAIAVEIVFVPPANAAAALTPPVVTLDQADTSVTELVHTDRDSKRLREMNEEPAPISKPERIDAVVLPPKPALRKTAAVRPAPPAKRRDVPVAVAQVSEATGAANGPPGGSSGMIGSARVDLRRPLDMEEQTSVPPGSVQKISRRGACSPRRGDCTLELRDGSRRSGARLLSRALVRLSRA